MRDYHRGVTRLRTLSRKLVEQCRQVWRVAAQLWREKARGVQEEEAQRAKEARRQARRVRLEAEAARLVRGRANGHRTDVISRGLASRALHKISAVAARLRGLSRARTREEERILEWGQWSERRMVAWYVLEMRAERRKRQRKAAVAKAGRHARCGKGGVDKGQGSVLDWLTASNVETGGGGRPASAGGGVEDGRNDTRKSRQARYRTQEKEERRSR